MPKVFLNHKTDQKYLVNNVKNYLESCFIKTWLDAKDMRPGAKMLDKIYEGIESSGYFIAFISEGYLSSDWCLEELEAAKNNGKIKIIPIIVAEDDKEIKAIKEKAPRWIKNNYFKSTIYTQMSDSNYAKRVGAVAEAIWEASPVRFKPLKRVTLPNGVEAQVITYENDSSVPTDLLKKWDIDILDFISIVDSDDKPIENLPVIFNGVAINWLLTNLSIPFFNKRDVLVYNSRKGEVICSYVKDEDSPLKLGDIYKLSL